MRLIDFMKRHWLLWLLLAGLLAFEVVSRWQAPQHGPYPCGQCLLQTPVPDHVTEQRLRQQMPRLYALPYVGALAGAELMTCTASHCAVYHLTADVGFVARERPIPITFGTLDTATPEV